MHPAVPIGARWSRECGAVVAATAADGEEFTAACTRPRGHAGPHRDVSRPATGTTWTCARCGMLTGVHAAGASCPPRAAFNPAGGVRPGARRAD